MAGQLAKTYERSRIPLYLQVASTLRRRIEDGQWTSGQKISTLEQLEAEFQVARVTVRQAIDVLEKEGLVQRQQGKGTFVAPGIKDKRWLRLETNWSSLVSIIRDNVPKFIAVDQPPSEPRLAKGDGRLAPEYRYLRSVQSMNNEPYAVASVHLAREVYESAPDAFNSHTALPILSALAGVEIARAHQTLVIGSADTETADLLKIALNAPTAEAHCVVVDNKGVAIYVGDIVYRGECVKLDIDLLRNSGN